MAEPFTLAALGAAVLSEGIRFLFDQATDLLRRRRDRREGEQPAEDTLELVDAGPLDAPLGQVRIDLDRLEARVEDLRLLRRELHDYVEDLEPVDPSDPALISRVEALRSVLEVVYGQRITFRGEAREQSGAVVDATMSADTVEGYVAAVRARRAGTAQITARLRVGEVKRGGEAVGADFDDLG